MFIFPVITQVYLTNETNNRETLIRWTDMNRTRKPRYTRKCRLELIYEDIVTRAPYVPSVMPLMRVVFSQTS